MMPQIPIDKQNLPAKMVVLTAGGPEVLCKSDAMKHLHETKPGVFKLGAYGVSEIRPVDASRRCDYCFN